MFKTNQEKENIGWGKFDQKPWEFDYYIITTNTKHNTVMWQVLL